MIARVNNLQSLQTFAARSSYDDARKTRIAHTERHEALQYHISARSCGLRSCQIYSEGRAEAMRARQEEKAHRLSSQRLAEASLSGVVAEQGIIAAKNW